MSRWYEENPGRLDHEIQELEKAGFSTSIDHAEREAGRLVLHIGYHLGGTTYPLKAIFPHEYPYFPFQVDAPTLYLAKHQNPYDKTLCFVADIESEWSVNDTVAKYLTERLPLVLAANGDQAVAEKIEAHEGAPVTEYMNLAPFTAVVVADWSLDPAHVRGTMRIGIEKDSNPNIALRGAVIRMLDEKGNQLGEAEAWLKTLYPHHIGARWVRLSSPPKSKRPDEVLKEAVAAWPALGNPQFRDGPDVVGVVFQDQARYREMHDLWVFLVRRRDRLVKQQNKKSARIPGNQISVYLARADRGAKGDRLARVPRLAPIADKKVAVFGLGALGSDLAWQLARAGVGGLALDDHDVVQAGNLPRWLVGWPAIGHPKAVVLTQFLLHHYPYVDTKGYMHRVGVPSSPLADIEKFMGEMLDGTHLIVDCSATFTVSHYLSTLAWNRGIPYVWATGTPGSWGGIVGRAARGMTDGCWKCFRHHLKDGRYREPAFDAAPNVQPIGCFSPTFTGTGFDMDHVSLMATRFVVATLCRGSETGYPDFGWDIGMTDMWRDGKPIAPTWETCALARHDECDMHD